MSKAILLSISGNVKVPIYKGTRQNLQIERRRLMSLEDHFDMLGNPTCKYRISHEKK